jgi:hypothetical protein
MSWKQGGDVARDDRHSRVVPARASSKIVICEARQSRHEMLAQIQVHPASDPVPRWSSDLLIDVLQAGGDDSPLVLLSLPREL